MSHDHETVVGHVLVERGLVTRDQLVECLREVGSGTTPVPGTGATTRLSDILVKKGYLKADQLDALRSEIGHVLDSTTGFEVIRHEDALIGQLLVRRRSITAEQLKEALDAQAAEGSGKGAPRLGEILIKRAFCTFADLEAALKAQAKRITLTCGSCGTTVAAAEFDPKKKYLCRKCSGSLTPKPARTPDPSAATSTVPRGGKEIPDVAQRAMRNPKNHFGKYWLVRELGRGGMGAVYQAWDGSLNRWVAVKVLLTQRDRDEVERFMREAQTAADLRHPNIIAIHETGNVDGRHFIAMEYIEGEQLGTDRVPIRKACELVRQVALALEVAHNKEIIHRDIKPQNIMLDAKGVPHVMDFGLAKSLTAESAITATGTIIGTPSYMPPEQAEGRVHRLDRRVDIYSLGAVLYELLTGRPPFKGATPVETLKQVLDKEAPPPSSLNPAVPRDVENIVLKCLEKDRERRYQTAASLARDLARYLEGEAVSARSLNVVERAAKKVRRNKLLYAAGAVLVVVPLVAFIAFASSRSDVRARIDGHARAAATFLEKENYEQAKAEFAAILALDGANRDALAGRARCDEALADRRKAADLAKLKADQDAAEQRKRQEQLRKDFTELVMQGDLKAAAKEWEAARLAYEKALAVGRDLPEAKPVDVKLTAVRKTIEEIEEKKRRDLALLQQTDAEREKKLLEAQPEFDAGKRKLDTADKDLYKPGADLSRTNRLASEAIAHFDKAVAVCPRHHEALLLRGKARMLRYEYPEAIADFTRAIDMVKTFASAFYERGRVYLQMFLDLMSARGWRGFAPSETAVAWLTKAAPDFTEARRLGLGEESELAAAYIAYAGENLETCVELCDRVLAKNDTKEEAWKLKGDALYRRSLRAADPDAVALALESYGKAIQNRVNYLDAYIMRGAILFESGRRDEAAADFTKAIAINPKNSWAHNAMALLHWHGRDLDKAIAELDQAVALDPNAPRAWGDRAMMKLVKKDWTAAVADADKAVAVNPDYASAWYARGGARMNLGNFREAIVDLKKSLELGMPAGQRGHIEQLIESCRQRLGD